MCIKKNRHKRCSNTTAVNLCVPFAHTGTHSHAHLDTPIVDLALLKGAEDIAKAANQKTVIMRKLWLK